MRIVPLYSAGCPVCGYGMRDGRLSCARADALRARASRLREQLSSLQNGISRIEDYRAEMPRMCGDCQMVMVGIVGEPDRAELAERLERTAQMLERDAQECEAA